MWREPYLIAKLNKHNINGLICGKILIDYEGEPIILMNHMAGDLDDLVPGILSISDVNSITIGFLELQKKLPST